MFRLKEFTIQTKYRLKIHFLKPTISGESTCFLVYHILQVKISGVVVDIT